MVARTARVMIVILGAFVFAEFGYGWTGYTDEPAKGPVGPPPGFDLSPPGDRASDVGIVSVEDDEPTPDAPPPSVDVPEDEPKTQDTARTSSGATETPTKGDKGDPGDRGEKGDRGDPGPQGPQGVPGVNADLCSNINGIQTKPPSKRWPQRYWGFKPRLEPRVLTINAKGHMVCVVVSWVPKHSLFARR